MVRKHYLVSGRVQGVGFRNFVYTQANSLGLSGRVRNLYDGRVEIVAQGEPETIRRLEALIAKGPSRASVSDIEAKVLNEESQQVHEFAVTEDGEDPWQKP